MTMQRMTLLAGAAGLLLTLAACGEKTEMPAEGTPAPAPVTPDALVLESGKRLFRQHCAQCHGQNAEGDPAWRKRRRDGSFPAPPLDGTGHAWHHSLDVLKMTIRDGTARLGGSMPAWGDKLSEAEIEAIIHWFQSRWPEEIRAEWQQRFGG